MTNPGARNQLWAFLRRFVVAIVCLTWVVGGGIGYATWVANRAVDQGERVTDLDLTTVSRGEPTNFLIIGSDSREFVSTAIEEDHFGTAAEQTGQRSDTMMVLHLEPETSTSLLVSFPRDLWVDIPGEGEAKLNAAYAHGGPKLAVETIESNFDIKINHYLEVDFATFRQMVESIGSVEIFFPTQARDVMTGLNVTKPGCVALDAEDALGYVRSRAYEYLDEGGEWHQDPTADIGRIRRQQYFIRSLMNEAIHKVARNPLRANGLIKTSTKYLRMDEDLDIHDIYDLYVAFRSTEADGVNMVTIPNDLARSDDGQSILVVRASDAAPILKELRNGVEPPKESNAHFKDIDPRTISVGTLNGSNIGGAAGDSLDTLVEAGFQRGKADNADNNDYDETQVHYRPGKRDQAELVAAYLVSGGLLVEDELNLYDVVVLIGADFAGVEDQFADSNTSVNEPSTTTIAAPANPGSTPGITVPPSEVGRPLVGCG